MANQPQDVPTQMPVSEPAPSELLPQGQANGFHPIDQLVGLLGRLKTLADGLVKLRLEDHTPEWANRLGTLSAQWETTCAAVSRFLKTHSESASKDLSSAEGLKAKFWVIEGQAFTILREFFAFVSSEQAQLLAVARNFSGEKSQEVIRHASSMLHRTETVIGEISTTIQTTLHMDKAGEAIRSGAGSVVEAVSAQKAKLDEEIKNLRTWIGERRATAAESPAAKKLSFMADAVRERHRNPELLKDDARTAYRMAQPYVVKMGQRPMIGTVFFLCHLILFYFFNIVARILRRPQIAGMIPKPERAPAPKLSEKKD